MYMARARPCTRAVNTAVYRVQGRVHRGSPNYCKKSVRSVVGGPTKTQLKMWANAHRDGRPAEYRWRPLFNAAKWLTPTTRVLCSNAAETRNPFKFTGVLQTPEPISAVSGPKFTILPGHVQEVLLFNSFFSDCRYMP